MDRTGTGLTPLGKGPPQAHLVGLDGEGMPAIAQLLVRRGFLVSGSAASGNRSTEHLGRLGVRIHAGHSPRSFPRSARLLIYGPEVPVEHPDRLTAARHGVRQAPCSQVLSELLGSGHGVTSAGGRKSGLAAAMVGWILIHAGLDPTVLLGRSSPQMGGGGGRLGLGPHVVVEAGDGPIAPGPMAARIAILHHDNGPAARSDALRNWAEAAPPGGYVLGFADEEDGVGPVPPAPAEVLVERFSLTRGHAWWAADLRHDRGRYRFRAFHRGRFAMEVRLQVPGRRQVLGALAAVAACGRVDVPSRAIREGLEEFAGISRGFESRGSYRGVTLVDDEARGPRAVAEALEIAREVYGRRRLCAAYRPCPSGEGPGPRPVEFAAADRVWVVDGEGPEARAEAGDLATALAAGGVATERASGLDGAIRGLDRHLEPGDVLVTLGAGDVGTIADAFLRRLPGDRHAG